MNAVKTFFFVFLLSLSSAAAGQDNYYNAGQLEAAEEGSKAQSFTVTSIQKCYQQLSREEALEIQNNFIKPYKECHRRLALQKLKKQESPPISAPKEVIEPVKQD